MKDIKMGNIFSKFVIEHILKNKNSKNDISKCINESDDFVQDIINKKEVLNAPQVWELKKKFNIDFCEIMFDLSDSPEAFSKCFIKFLKEYRGIL